jgi:dTDP-4-amino-4,6-dideoxygalactose transaminase
MDPSVAIAEKRGIYILEDAAQAHGARYRGRRVGSLGHVTAWSFYPTKNLGAFGDSGAVTTDDPDIADKIRLIRNYGARTKYLNEVKGVNSRMEELHAAMLRVKLRYLDQWNARRVEQARSYLSQLQDTGLRFQDVPDWAQPVWHIFTLRTSARDALQERLTELGVGTLVHYPVPPHLQSAYSEMGFGEGDYPLSEEIHRQVLSLPIGPHVTHEETEQIIAAVKAAASEVM